MRRFENVKMEVIREWFEENNYDSDMIEIGYFGIKEKGYQDIDCFEITENTDETFNLDIN